MIGQTIKSYVVEDTLGKGGMGVVYRARDQRLGRPVALKVLRPEIVRNPDRRRRFIQEARAASAVNHPAIAQIYEIEDSGDVTFIAMEYVDGSTVREMVGRGELDIPSAVEVAIQVGDALSRAHQAGIIHRDIKSDNVMVTRDGHPKILDFGLAKLLDVGQGPAPGAGEAGMSRLETLGYTQAGMILGTVAYMSPEQARGLPTDRRSDIFSFGVLLYEMTAGKVPFGGASALDTLHAIAYEQTRPITTLRPDLPYSLQRVVDRCLQKKPEDRYQDLRETVEDLKAVKKEIDSGVARGVPLVDRLRFWASGLTTRGMVWSAIAGAVLGGLLILFLVGGANRDFGPLVIALIVGFVLYRRFRNRGQREMRRFVKKGASLREVGLITFHKNQFTVVTRGSTPRTYLKLNAYLDAANQRLYRGDPMTMVVLDRIDEEEERRILSSPGVQFVREGRPRASRLTPNQSGG